MSRAGDQVDADLLVKDLVESNLESGLQIKYPVCFDCFDKILSLLDLKMKEQQDKSNVFANQLRQLEEEERKVKKKTA